MALLLDTSVAIGLIDAAPQIIQRRRHIQDEPFLSVVSSVELEAGVYSDGNADPRIRERVDQLLSEIQELPFTRTEVEAYAAIIAEKGFTRRLVVDRMIAASALANDLTLATLNPRDFRDIPGLEIEDWSA